MPRRVVVVGAGLSGTRTCAELRGRGYDGELTLVGAERHPPYDRPPLSKALLRAVADSATPAPPAVLDFDPAALGVSMRLATTATALWARDHGGVLETTSGEIGYDGLVLACGSEPVRLPDQAGALTLRTLDDARVLHERLRPKSSLLVVGAGWIAAEVASAAADRGMRATVLEAAATPVPTLDRTIGSVLAGWYAEAGVTLRSSTPVAAAAAGRVVLADGSTLTADTVLVAVGVRPAISWLTGSALRLGVGVLVDASLASSVPGVVAVGDCAERYSERLSAWVRSEHWDDALRAPAIAAATLLGETASYDPVPYVWSEQFGRYVQVLGDVRGAPQLWRGRPDSVAGSPGWAAGWLDDAGRLRGFLAVDRGRDATQARKRIAAGRDAVAGSNRAVDPARFADPQIAIRDA